MARPDKQSSIESPCVRNCCLDSEDICMGCGRHMEEILQWHRADASERETILARAAKRRQAAKKTSFDHNE
jgi:predicted Fe-S protein YdhL (DUF1289 family)